MNDKVKIVFLIIVFIISLIFIKKIVNKESTDKDILNSSTKAKAAIEVNESNFEAEVINSDKKILVDFYATWCNPCKVMTPILEEIAYENENIKLVKIDVDQNQDLAYTYRITAMPTIVIIENGKEINRHVGATDKKNVLELLNSYH